MASPDLLVSQDRCGDVTLAVNPFVSNRYHFGMLLGVADLEAEQAYHRGKMWLHNMWLHGIGTVWGLRVELREASNEVVVHPGLAIDAHGRELFVSQPLCVDIGAWFDQRRPDELVVTDHADGGVTFTAHVELCHDSCLDRPVPSISEPCDDASFDTAYSRAIERGHPRIAAGPAPDEPPPWYPRLRQFFGQIAATDPLVLAAFTDIDGVTAAERPARCLQWFRHLAAEDTMALGPEEGAGWSAVAGDGCVPLAQLELHLGPDRMVVVDGADSSTVDNHVRPSHVRTRTIQELLCHHHGAGAATDPADPVGPADPVDPAAGAPPQAEDSATIAGRTVTVVFTRPLDESTISTDAFTVSVLRSDGWNQANVIQTALDADGVTVRIGLSGAPRSRPVRIVARGTGPEPIMGADARVLSGIAGDPYIPAGADAALMITATDHDDQE
jgi:hypothetical protein